MYIFNTTFLVSDKIYDVWLKWIQEVHIPAMSQLGCLNPQLAKILSSESEHGTSYALQFHAENIDVLQNLMKKYEEHFPLELKSKFGEEVLCFSTIMEIVK